MNPKTLALRFCGFLKAKLPGEEVTIEKAVESVVQRLQGNHLSVSWGDRLLTIDKTAGFLEEPRFASAYGEIRGAHQYDQYGGNHTIAWRLRIHFAGLRAGVCSCKAISWSAGFSKAIWHG